MNRQKESGKAIPDDDPRYAIHRIVIQMVMDGIELLSYISWRNATMRCSHTKSSATANFSFKTPTLTPVKHVSFRPVTAFSICVRTDFHVIPDGIV